MNGPFGSYDTLNYSKSGVDFGGWRMRFGRWRIIENAPLFQYDKLLCAGKRNR